MDRVALEHAWEMLEELQEEHETLSERLRILERNRLPESGEPDSRDDQRELEDVRERIGECGRLLADMRCTLEEIRRDAPHAGTRARDDPHE